MRSLLHGGLHGYTPFGPLVREQPGVQLLGCSYTAFELRTHFPGGPCSWLSVAFVLGSGYFCVMWDSLRSTDYSAGQDVLRGAAANGSDPDTPSASRTGVSPA